LFVRSFACLEQHRDGILDVALEDLEPLGTDSTIHNSVVTAHGDVHHVGDLVALLRVVRDHDLLGGAYGENARLGRVDDGGELLDAKHAQVRDGEGSSLELLGLELALLGPCGQILDGGGDVRETPLLSGEDNGGDEAARGGNRHGDVGAVVLADRVVVPRAVDLGHLEQGLGGGLDQEIIHRELHL